MSAVIMKEAEKADNTAELLGAKTTLVGLTRDELTEALKPLGVEPFRTKQVWQWLYGKGVTDFALMSNIAKSVQEKLTENFSIARAGISRNAISLDETQKWLLKFADENEVETVFIPESNRGTLCVSSQVGCTLACTFCHTGTQRLVRNLTAGEIITQVLVARDGLGEWPTLAPIPRADKTQGYIPRKPGTNKTDDEPDRQLSNIVFMGMGEPLFNYDNVVKACQIMMDGEGLKLSRRKITVSTSGVVPKIVPLAHDAGVNLAISLHAVNDDLRNEIVPINRKYPIKDLLEAVREYQSIVSDRHIMFEYVMLEGVNDSEADAKEMVRLLKGIRSKVNLIPFNPWPGAPYKCSSNNRIHAFGRIIMEGGIASPIRKTRGEDIMAACGQLKSLSELKKGQKVKLK
jgi:23S rRNA (adenine2503-C2)-methyltransferase